MAESEHDPRVSSRYRELAREEPPPQLDAAILAASRRAAEVHPAPLVAPTGRRRWYFPLAAAAIIVLAVAVTLQVERQQPDPELAVPPITAPQVLREERAAQLQAQAESLKAVPSPAPARKAALPSFAPDPKPAAPQAARELGARRDAIETQSAPVPAPASAQRAMAKLAAEPPEKWLERIAELRAQGKHEEADKALAEFKRRYPDYRISEAMLEKLEKK